MKTITTSLLFVSLTASFFVSSEAGITSSKFSVAQFEKNIIANPDIEFSEDNYIGYCEKKLYLITQKINNIILMEDDMYTDNTARYVAHNYVENNFRNSSFNPLKEPWGFGMPDKINDQDKYRENLEQLIKQRKELYNCMGSIFYKK